MGVQTISYFTSINEALLGLGGSVRDDVEADMSSRLLASFVVLPPNDSRELMKT